MAPKKKATGKATAAPEEPKPEEAKEPTPAADSNEGVEEEDYGEENMEEEHVEEPDEPIETDDAHTAAACAEAPTAGKAVSKAAQITKDVDDGAKDDEEAEGEEEDVFEPKQKEKPKELEVDDQPDDRPRVAVGAVGLSEYDSTLDVFFNGNIVSSLSQGGFAHLFSGVRANTGAKAGRHLFEVKVLEKKSTEGDNMLRVGVSLSKSSLFLGDGTFDSAAFDMNGLYYAPIPEEPNKRHRKAFKHPKVQYQVVGILINLDSGSPNANTLSMFVDGVRVCEPMPLPSHLVGKALHPTITFKNFTLAVNLGSDGFTLKHLPFTSRMLGSAAAADVESSSNAASNAAGSKYSVVVPVGLPDQGFFDYVDRFLESHPDYVELSDRKILEWCQKSCLSNWKTNKDNSRDRPAFNFGIHSIDNRAIRMLLRSLTQLVKRNYLVAELKSNLLSTEREEVLSRFSAPHFSVTAHVLVGEPAAEHKEWVHKKIMQAFEKKKADKTMRAQKAEERKAKAQKAKAAKAAEAAKKDESKTEEVKAEDAKADELKVEEVKAEEEPEKAGEPEAKRQKVEEEEKDEQTEQAPEVGPHVWYMPRSKHDEDLTKTSMSSFQTFSLPSDSEGFAGVEFLWSAPAQAQEYLKKWVKDKKATLIIEGLKPGTWFKEKQKAWKQTFSSMRTKKQEKKTPKNDAKEENKDSKEDDASKDKKDENEQSAEKKEEEDPLAAIHTGGDDGKPIYASFSEEDWLLLQWRYELHLLCHSFMGDVQDMDLGGIPVDHVEHYFNLYHGKGRYRPRSLGCKDLAEIIELMDDMFKIEKTDKMSFLCSTVEKEEPVITFVKQVEEARQDRVRRIEAGDESARLKILEAREDLRDDGDRPERKFGKGKRKGAPGAGRLHREAFTGRVAGSRKGGFSSQVKRSGFGIKRFGSSVKRQGKGDSKSFKSREAPRPHRETAPWERARTQPKGKGKAASAFSSGKGRSLQQERRPVQESHFQRRSAAQDSRRPPDTRSGEKGHGKRRFSSGPDPKRQRFGTPSSRDPPAPPRPPTSFGVPSRRPATTAFPSTSRPVNRDTSRSKGPAKGWDSGHRDSKGSSRDTGSSYREGSYHDKGSSKGSRDSGARRDGGKDRYSSKGGSSRGVGSHDGGRDSHGKGGRDARRDGRDRGGHSSGGDRRGGGDRNRDRRW